HEYQVCLNYKDGKFDVLYGYDELLLPAVAGGAKGAVGSTYNFAAPMYLKVMELFNNGKLGDAQTLQLMLVNMIREIVKFPQIPAQNAIVTMVGSDLGPSRLPLGALAPHDRFLLPEGMEAIGFFNGLGKNPPPHA